MTDSPLNGVLHVYIAFDWGDAMDLERARRLVPAEVHALPRRRRTPSSIAYRPPPLRFYLPNIPLDLPELGAVQAPAEATVFDLAAVSVAIHLPFVLAPAALTRLAGWLADSGPLVAAARKDLDGLYRQLLPAITDPLWKDDLSEEYVIFQLPPTCPVQPAFLLGE